jgi:DNA-binding beta-propeller fold protein YncE
MHRQVVGVGLWIGLCSCAQETPLASVDTRPPDTPPALTSGPTLAVAAHDASTFAPVDATPSPDGQRIYYLAVSNDQALDQPSPGVFSVETAAEGKGEIARLALGAPLSTPFGIDISLDGKTLFIADTSSGADASGGVYSLAAGGGTPVLLAGTEGYRPAGLVLGKQRDEEVLFFTGREPASGAAAVFRVASSGGNVTTLASFVADSEPGGVALAADGDLYIADHAGGAARVLKLHDDTVSVVLSEIGLGFPAGVALTSDDSALLVSGLDVETKHDVVYSLELGSGKVTRVSDGIDKFSESAGLHRAHGVNVFAWADSQADGAGTVYSVRL